MSAFLSYRHENDTHRARVRALAERLRAEGSGRLTVVFDQFAHHGVVRGLAGSHDAASLLGHKPAHDQ